MIKKLSTIAVLLSVLLGALSDVARSDTTIFTERSLYRNIFVTENSDTRCLRFSTRNNTLQSCFSLKNPDTVLFECNKMLLGALYLHPTPRRVLMIGLGGGTLATTFSRLLPSAELDVVEIDNSMVRVAKDYFNFRPTPKVRVTVQDGRVFVKRAVARGEKYDLIILDAFDEVYIPAHMMTRQFLVEVQKLLTPEGVVAANTYCSSSRYDMESVTYHSVFGPFFNLKKFWKNARVIIAKQDGLPPDDVLKKNAKALEEKLKKCGVETSWLLPLFSTEQDWDEGARIITDLYVPF